MLIALFISGAVASPPIAKQLGYPIFIERDERGCAYGIQDMIMHDEAMVAEWMRNYPVKARRIDIVVDAKSPKQCIDSAKSIAQKEGYSDIVVRNGSTDEYDIGPPRP